MRRRDFIALLGAAATLIPTTAWPQSPPLIGVLDAASAVSTKRYHEALRGGLAQLGYIDGRNIRLEYRYADGFIDRLPDLAADLVRLDPKIIVSAPLPANLAAHNATSKIPIVMATGADPVYFGLVQSLSHPGGNITGLTNFAEELASKQLDLIRELLPRVTHIGTIVNATNPLHEPEWRDTQSAADNASLRLTRIDYKSPEDLERAFERFAAEKVEAVLIPPDTTFSAHRGRITELAAQSRLPTIYFTRYYIEAGGLLGRQPTGDAEYG